MVSTNTIRKSFKYRLYPSQEVVGTLSEILRWCRHLYNAALEVRRDTYRREGKTLTAYDQWKEASQIYKEMTADIPRFNAHAFYQETTLGKLDKAFEGYFRRVKAWRAGDKSKKPGYPRFQGADRFCSIVYPDKTKAENVTHSSGWKLILPEKPRRRRNDGTLILTGIGSIKVRLHRPLKGHIRTCTVKREGSEWYVIFSCELTNDSEPAPLEQGDVGIDVGLYHYAALSDGTIIDNPRHFRTAECKLAEKQRVVARKKKGSKRWKQAKHAVSKAHRKIKRQRHDFLHKHSRTLVNTHKTIYVEDLRISNLMRRPEPVQGEDEGHYLPNGASAKSGLNKSIGDAGWGSFVQYLTYKAEWAGKEVVKVDPRGTSQRCSQCGATVSKDLSERWHECPECGHSVDRDVNSAQEILRLGHNLRLGRSP